MSYYSGRQSSDHAHYPPADAPSSSDSPPRSSGAATPTSTSAGSSSFLSSSFYGAFGGLMRRLSSDPAGHLQPHSSASAPPQQHSHLSVSESSSSGHYDDGRSIGHAATFPAPSPHHGSSNNSNHFLHSPSSASFSSTGHNGVDGVYTPPFARTASPLRPPPLEPLTLKGFHPDTPQSARLLTAAIAEEIRIMVPERLRIEDVWKLVYSLDQDGASLATLYEKTAAYEEHRIGFVLVVKDQEGGIFGAYLTEHPHPSPHYFGTGECFLWRASLLAPLPPPPSADTTHLTTRSTTIAASPTHPTFDAEAAAAAASSSSSYAYPEPLIPGLGPAATTPASSTTSFASTSSHASSSSSLAASAASTQPPRSPPPQLAPQPPPTPSIRFSAFPYSGVNEYFIYCESHSLSVGGGDGKYGLWLNDSLEKGISATCLTFGNQPLSDEGEKFGVLGVEVWVIGSQK